LPLRGGFPERARQRTEVTRPVSERAHSCQHVRESILKLRFRPTDEQHTDRSRGLCSSRPLSRVHAPPTSVTVDDANIVVTRFAQHFLKASGATLGGSSVCGVCEKILLRHVAPCCAGERHRKRARRAARFRYRSRNSRDGRELRSPRKNIAARCGALRRFRAPRDLFFKDHPRQARGADERRPSRRKHWPRAHVAIGVSRVVDLTPTRSGCSKPSETSADSLGHTPASAAGFGSLQCCRTLT
jgi:hypothetical protein